MFKCYTMIVTAAYWHRLLADALLILHCVYVLFVVVGFVAVWIGYFSGWGFIRNFYFRIFHVLAIGIVALQAVVGVMCPFTVWENDLRLLGSGEQRYQGTFIEYWLHKVLYHDISLQTFAVVYGLFLICVVVTYILIRPDKPGRRVRFLENDEKNESTR